MKRNKLLVILMCLVFIFSFTMCKNQSTDTYNSYLEKYGMGSDEDLKKAMQSMKENEDYSIYNKDGKEESKIHRKCLLDLYDKNDFSAIKTYIDNNKLLLGKNLKNMVCQND